MSNFEHKGFDAINSFNRDLPRAENDNHKLNLIREWIKTRQAHTAKSQFEESLDNREKQERFYKQSMVLVLRVHDGEDMLQKALAISNKTVEEFILEAARDEFYEYPELIARACKTTEKLDLSSRIPFFMLNHVVTTIAAKQST